MTDDKEYEPQLTPNMAGKLLKADELAAVYIKIRTAIKDKEEEHKTELAPLQEQIDIRCPTDPVQRAKRIYH